MSGFRQEVLNVLLAQVLAERGIVAVPETILKSSVGNRKMPDVLVEYQGLRVMIEGEVESPQARAKALKSAHKRVEDGIAHIGIAVVYPASLRDADFATVKDDLAASTLHIAVVVESGDGDFVQGDVTSLEHALRTAFDHLIKEDVVAEAVAAIDAGVEKFASVITFTTGNIARLANALGIRALDTSSTSTTTPDKLTPEQRAAISRISGLVVCNAMIFHEILVPNNPQVVSLKDMPPNSIVSQKLCEQWAIVLAQINYYPIFHLAREVLLSIGVSADVEHALMEFGTIALEVVFKRAALRHDLMGRIYHRLLSEAKYLGTYYTRIPSAALLLKLALYKANGGIDWHNLNAISQLRIADLSCGTGTLLTASADAVMDNYVRASADAGHPVDLDDLQKTLLENVLYGYDVLPSAIHLTASTLALRAPETTIGRMCLYSLPHGGPEHRLGSIEFLKGNSIQMMMDLFGAVPKAQQVTGANDEAVLEAPLPMLDLCAINPPFTRSVGGNLLFGSVPPAERTKMQKDLQKMVQQNHISASITAGLGSIFIALADRYIKRGGRLALVIPKALLSGVAWKKTRDIINQGYHMEYLITSQDPHGWNFSESTSLSEILMVAVKHHEDGQYEQTTTMVINLWRMPNTSFEAMAVARQVIQQAAPDMATGQGALNLSIGNHKVGEALSLPWHTMQQDWMLPCTFAQSDLIRVAYHLQQGNLWVPGYGQVGKLPFCPLQTYGTLGPDRRDIHDGFALSQSITSYPTFWGHKSEDVYTMEQKPNAYLTPLSHAKSGRKLRNVHDLWHHAGRILLVDRMWLTTHKLTAIRFSEPVLSNVWWELSGIASESIEKALLLWLNSSLGILSLLLYRTETRGAWINFKKPTLLKMPVINTHKISTEKIAALESAYDRLCTESLQRIPQIASDPVRAQIDASIAEAFDLPDLAPIRALLGHEPIISQKRL